MIESLKLILAKVKALLRDNAELAEVQALIRQILEELNDVNPD